MGCLVVFKIVVSFFAVLGLHGYMGFSLFAASGSCFLAPVCRLLIVVAPLVVAQKL